MVSNCLQYSKSFIITLRDDGDALKFHTPNIIVVFSNEKPDVSQMSKDRWKIFHIRDEELLDATDKYL